MKNGRKKKRENKVEDNAKRRGTEKEERERENGEKS